VVRIFLLSPAKLTGRRAEILLNERATFDLAKKMQDGGARIYEVYSFLSGLYFRGKVLYANCFARPFKRVPGVLIITSDRGLISAKTWITMDDLRSFSKVSIDTSDPRYLEPLKASARDLAEKLPHDSEIVLLGSIGTQKYVQPLIEIFDARLKFPIEFVGRGDMSRGGLMLRCVDEVRELQYVPLIGAIRHGKRPPKLRPRVGSS
jgi:hypothetical protein